MNARFPLCFLVATILGCAGSLTGWGQEPEARKNIRREIERLWESSLQAQKLGDLEQAQQLKRQVEELIIAERARLKELAAGTAKDQETLERITEKLKAVAQQEAEAAAKRIKIDPDKLDPAGQQIAKANPDEPSGDLKRDLQEIIENLKLAEKHLRRAGQNELATRVRGEVEKIVRLQVEIEKDKHLAARRRADIAREAAIAKQPAERAEDARVEEKASDAASKIDHSIHDGIKYLRQELEKLRAEVKELRAAMKKERQ